MIPAVHPFSAESGPHEIRGHVIIDVNWLDVLPALKDGDSQVASAPCEGLPSSYGDSLKRQRPASLCSLPHWHTGPASSRTEGTSTACHRDQDAHIHTHSNRRSIWENRILSLFKFILECRQVRVIGVVVVDDWEGDESVLVLEFGHGF